MHSCFEGYGPRVSVNSWHVSGETDRQTSNAASYNMSISCKVECGTDSLAYIALLLQVKRIICRGALDNLAPQHKYSHYIYVSQHEMQVSDTFLGKKIKLGRFILDKS